MLGTDCLPGKQKAGKPQTTMSEYLWRTTCPTEEMLGEHTVNPFSTWTLIVLLPVNKQEVIIKICSLALGNVHFRVKFSSP